MDQTRQDERCREFSLELSPISLKNVITQDGRMAKT
jgi:hypothetical protein